MPEEISRKFTFEYTHLEISIRSCDHQLIYRTVCRMGWSSWNVFAGSIDEEKIMSTIDAMAELKDAGYTYVNVVRLTDSRQIPCRISNL